MVSSEVVNWIKTQKAAGYNDEQLRNSLLQKGHSPKDVNDAFMQVKKDEIMGSTQKSSITPVTKSISQAKPVGAIKSQAKPIVEKTKLEAKFQTEQKTGVKETSPADNKKQEKESKKNKEIALESEKKKTTLLPIIIIGAMLILLTGGGAYYYFNVYTGGSSSIFSFNSNNAQQEQESVECAELPEKLLSCEPYSCEFIHPLTGDTLSKEVRGLTEEDCTYYEQMPNGGSMTCQYNEEFRAVMSQFYKEFNEADAWSTEVNVDIEYKEVTSYSVYTINGTETENPLQMAMDTGVCVVKGY